METATRFTAESGRKRPPYQPKNIKCPHCGGGLTIKDERSELVVCEYCGSHLDVSQEEKTVLGKGAERQWEFPLRLGDSFRRKQVRYEIIARMVFIEDGDENELSRQYLLYNPYHGTLWLDEYQGHYSISTDTHVMPSTDPFTKRRGDVLKTYDNREWVTEGKGTYELMYVDGALPWIANVGDQVDYVEFVHKTTPSQQYEVQRIAGEIEYGTGETLTLQQLRQAIGKPEFGGKTARAISQQPATTVADTRKWYVRLIAAAIVCIAINGVLYLYTQTRGQTVLTQSFSAADLTKEAYSNPFEVLQPNNIVKVTVNANLDNAWMALDVAFVWQEDTVIHVEDADVSYYHGVEGGESWSEGSRSKSIYVKVPWAGKYRLLLHAVSASGNTETATEAMHNVEVRVVDGALMPNYAIAGMIISGIICGLTVYSYKKWRDEDEEDDDD